MLAGHPDAVLSHTSPFANGTTVYVDPNGKAFLNGSFTDTPFPGVPNGIYGTPNKYYANFQGYTGTIDNYNYKVSGAGTLGQNNTDLQLVLPLTRYNFLARGNYEVNDWIGVFGFADEAFGEAHSTGHRSFAWLAQGDVESLRGSDAAAADLYRRAAMALHEPA